MWQLACGYQSWTLWPNRQCCKRRYQLPTKRVYVFLFFHLEIESMSIFWFLNPVEGSFTTDLMRCKLTRIDLITTACLRWNWGGTRLNQEFLLSLEKLIETLYYCSQERQQWIPPSSPWIKLIEIDVIKGEFCLLNMRYHCKRRHTQLLKRDLMTSLLNS